MPHRFIDSSRLGRARKITEKSIVDFKILRDIPLSVYGLIQGSARTPYTVIIDTEKGFVAHKCPDVIPGRWCKHIGKILLKISPESLEEIAKADLDLITRQDEIDNILSSMKSAVIVKEPTSEDVTIDDLLISVARLQKPDSDAPIVKVFLERFQEELDNETPLFQLVNIENILNTEQFKNVDFVKDILQDFILQRLGMCSDYLLEHFWVLSNVKRLEFAWLLRNIYRKLKLDTPTVDLEPPQDVSIEELIDAEIILSMLERKEPNPINFRFSSQSIITREEYDNRFERIAQKIRLSGTSVEPVKEWVYSRSQRFKHSSYETEQIDDLLLYILAANGENPQVSVKVSNRYQITHLPVLVQEKNPGLRFALERIKQSERDYLTREEITRHKHFFKCLSKGTFSTNYTESLRERAPDSVLDIDGFIVQWDFCANGVFPQFIHCLMPDRRMIIDSSLSIYPKIQPFDLTICRSSVKPGQNYTQIVTPEAILMPNQAIDLILSGTRVFSAILPWNVLSNFAQTGYIASGEISVAIKQCEDHQFAFGSLDLKRALEELALLGKQGMSEERYSKIHPQLKTSSGRLNSQTRPLCREILVGEGKPLETLLSPIQVDESDKLRTVLKAARISTTLQTFRKEVTGIVVKDLLLERKSLKKFLDSINIDTFGSYAMIIQTLEKELKESFDSFRKKLFGKKRPTRAALFRLMIGKVLMNELRIPRRGSFKDEELEALKLRTKQIQSHFN